MRSTPEFVREWGGNILLPNLIVIEYHSYRQMQRVMQFSIDGVGTIAREVQLSWRRGKAGRTNQAPLGKFASSSITSPLFIPLHETLRNTLHRFSAALSSWSLDRIRHVNPGLIPQMSIMICDCPSQASGVATGTTQCRGGTRYMPP